MNTPLGKKMVQFAFCAGLGIVFCNSALANSTIITDGTTHAGGPADLSIHGTGHVDIDGKDFGHQGGGNLIFSFNRFGVGKGDSASFTCTGSCNGASVNNVIARVTGTNVSAINGSVSSHIGNASFWFFNPNGVVLGNGASIDVGGSLHISTQNSLNFSNGNILTASTNAGVQNANWDDLNNTAPTEFQGGTSSAALKLQGATLTAGGDIDLSAQDIELDGDNHFNAASGTIGNATLNADNNLNLSGGTSTFSVDGDVTLAAVNDIVVDSGQIIIDNAGANAASVTAGHDLTVSGGGRIERQDGDGDFDVTANNSLSVTGSGSSISTSGGNTTIDGNNSLSVTDNAEISSTAKHVGDISVQSSNGSVDVNTGGKLTFANTGNAVVNAKTALTVARLGAINASNTGDFEAQADADLTVDGGTINAGNTDNAQISAGKTVSVQNGGRIERSNGSGNFDVKGGTATFVTGADSKIALTGGSGDANITGNFILYAENGGEISSTNGYNGNITLQSSNIDVNSSGKLTFANNGDLILKADNLLRARNLGLISVNNTGYFNAIATDVVASNGTFSVGNNSGALIEAGTLSVNNGGQLSFANKGDAAIMLKTGDFSVTDGGYLNFANHGNATVSADRLSVSNLAVFNANNTGAFDAKIKLFFTVDNATFSVGDSTSDAFISSRYLDVKNGSQLSFANHGNVAVRADDFSVVNQSSLNANNTGGFLATIKEFLTVDNGVFSVNNNTGDATLNARYVDVLNGAKLAFTNSSDASVNATKVLSVEDGGKLTFANSGNASVKATKLVFVKNGGIIARAPADTLENQTVGDFTINTRSLAVSGKDSKITVDKGDMVINAGYISLNGNNDAANPDSKGHYTQNILGTGDGKFFFNGIGGYPLVSLENSVIQNKGGIVFNNFHFYLVQSGILSTTSGVEFFNNLDFFYDTPILNNYLSQQEDLVLLQSKNQNFIAAADQVLISYLSQDDAIAKLLVNKLDSLLVGNTIKTTLPKNPCESQQGNSSLTAQNTSGFLPKASEAMPYSIMSSIETKVDHATFISAAEQPLQVAIADNKVSDCL